MFTKSIQEISPLDWGNGTSHRLIVKSDGMGFALAHTVVRAGTESKLQYRNNLEACYCISGSGSVEDTSGNVHTITPGVVYALDNHDKHYLRADPEQDMALVSIFNPPISGTESHQLSGDGFSSY